MRNASLSSVSLSLALLAGCASQPHQQAAAAGGRPPVAVVTTHIDRSTIADVQTLDGQVAPYLQANLATETSGTVVAVYANQGDHVHAGEVLAKIDDAPLKAQLQQQLGSQAQAAAKLSESQTQQPITATGAQSALEQAELNLIQAKKQLLTDDAALRQNLLTYQADQHLLGEGYVANTTFAQARATYIASDQTLSIDRNRVSQAYSALRTAQRNLLNIKLQSQVVDENRGALNQAAGGTQLLKTQLGETVLTAPFDAEVTQRTLDPGSYAGPNQPVFSLAQISRVYITFNVADSQLAYVHQHMPVTFDTSSVPGRVFHANVDVINVVPTAGTLLYPARLNVANPGEELRGGMLVHVHIVKDRVRNALVVPVAALSQEPDGTVIYAVVPDGDHQVAKRIVVQVGIQNADHAQIISPEIHDGMTVVSTKPDLLQDGAAVAIK